MEHPAVPANSLSDNPKQTETPGMARKIAWITTSIWYTLAWLTVTVWTYISLPIEGFYDFCHGTAGTAYPTCTGAETLIPVWQPPFLALIPALIVTLPFIVVSLILTIRHRKNLTRTPANTTPTPGDTPTRAPRTGGLYALLGITSLLLIGIAGLLIYGLTYYFQDREFDSKFETRYSSNPDRTECTTWEVVKDGIGASAPTPIDCAEIPDWYWEQQDTQ